MSEDVTWRAIAFRNRNRRQKRIFVTGKWFQNFAIELWPALSADLNSIENLWEIPARKLYDQEKPFVENTVELKKGIKSAWLDIRNESLNKLVDNVPDNWVNKSNQR